LRLRPTPEVMRPRPTVWPRGQFGLEALTSLVLSSNRLIFLYSIIFREKQGTCIPNYGEGASRVFVSPDCIQHVPRCQESQSGGTECNVKTRRRSTLRRGPRWGNLRRYPDPLAGGEGAGCPSARTQPLALSPSGLTSRV